MGRGVWSCGAGRGLGLEHDWSPLNEAASCSLETLGGVKDWRGAGRHARGKAARGSRGHVSECLCGTGQEPARRRRRLLPPSASGTCLRKTGPPAGDASAVTQPNVLTEQLPANLPGESLSDPSLSTLRTTTAL